MKLDKQRLIEKNLNDILKPIDPKERYVQSLYNRLITKPIVTIEYPNLIIVLSILATGLFFGTFFIWLITRIKVIKKGR